MKIVIVCDDLIQFGGQENLVLAVSEVFPGAPIYSSVISKKWKKVLREKGIKFKTSFLQYFPFVEKLNRYYSVFYPHILAFENFDFTNFDVVLSISSRFAHFVITKPGTKHICYMNSPGRMIWEPASYFEQETYGKLSKLKKLGDLFVIFPTSFMRLSDYAAAHRVDFFVANAKTPQNRIKKYYGLDSKIIYPFVDCDLYKDATLEKGKYFLVLSRVVSWKKLDVAVEACSRLRFPLKVAGDGPDLERLKGLAGNSVEFIGYISPEKIESLIKNCIALINTQAEDFGLVPLEGMACGKPVIAYKKGGALETVVEGETGEFFDEQTPESLIELLKKFNPKNYRPEACRKQAEKFDKKIFVKKIASLVNSVYLKEYEPL